MKCMRQVLPAVRAPDQGTLLLAEVLEEGGASLLLLPIKEELLLDRI
jgi:hypothetical protein